MRSSGFCWREASFARDRRRRVGGIRPSQSAPDPSRPEIADLDLLIAATALVHRLTVATLSVRDFSAVEGLAWEDWSK